MKIGVFGGAFNPPHIGHTGAVKTAAMKHGLDRVIVIPTGTPPHKEMPQGTPPPDMRLSMTENAFNNLLPDISVSDIEIYSQESNYTIDTIRLLQKQYPGAEFFLLLGDDMYNSLHTWKNSEELLRMIKPVLMPRDVIDISSTQIRALLKERGGAEYVTEDNYSLIIKHRFYDAKPNWGWLRGRAHSMLDPARIPHVSGAEQVAIELAVRWNADVDDAREAAILHDITKKLDFHENMCIITDNGIPTDNYSQDEEKLLHSITGALLAKAIFGVSDTVARAIELHTTGSGNMTMLDKIVYIADYIEPTRVLPGVDKLRKLAFTDIDSAMVLGLQMSVDDLIERGKKISGATYDALSSLTSRQNM